MLDFIKTIFSGLVLGAVFYLAFYIAMRGLRLIFKILIDMTKD